MGAKHLYLTLVVTSSVVLGACSNVDLKRFAPPGIIRYENLAKDQPVNPVVDAKIDEIKSRKRKAFPVLSEKAFDAPDGINAKTRESAEVELIEKRESLEARIADSRTAAAAERISPLEEEKNLR